MADISSIAAASGGLRTGLKSMMLSTSCDGGGDVDFDGPSSSNPRDTVSRVVSFGLIKKFPHNFEKCFIHKPRCDHCSKRIKINKGMRCKLCGMTIRKKCLEEVMKANCKEGVKYMKDVDRQSGAVPVEARLNSGGCRIADGDLVVDDSTVLGSGGSGTVTTGMWLGTTKVAVKKLNAASDATEDEISEMYDEMFLLSKLHHPNIVTFYGYSHSAGSLCIVTEYVAGGDLSAYIFDTLRHPAYTLGHTLAVAKSICAGMIYLDSQKVVHRDLKPGNVLVTDWAAGAVKICDFGLSEMLVRRGLLAKSVFSTPAYSAPEISRSEHTGKVDVYSFGIVLWEMAARRHAWEDYKFAVDIERDVANGMRPDMPPAEGVPAWYCDLVKKCWDPVPYSRPSFREIFDTISAHQDDLH